jgi:hypothetical protein
MTPSDLPPVEDVAEIVHPAYPEDASVFTERLNLYPAGCLVLEINQTIQGYAIGHPCLIQHPPALNTLLGRLPHAPNTFHIHDLALLPAARGARHANAAIDIFIEQAKALALPRMSLIAVGKSPNFWRRNGFAIADQTPVRACLATYGDSAIFMTRTL